MTEDVLDEPEAKAVIILQPFWHFVLLSALTLGIYSKIWSYGVWTQLKDDGEVRRDPIFDIILHPLVKSILDIVFSFSLFRYVTEAAKKKDIVVDYSPFLFAGCYSFLLLFIQIEFPWVLLAFIFWVPEIPLFFTYRKYLETKKTVCVFRQRMRFWELIMLVIGVHLSMAIVNVSLNPDLINQVYESSSIFSK